MDLRFLQGIRALPNTQCVNHVSGIICKLSLDNYSASQSSASRPLRSGRVTRNIPNIGGADRAGPS